MGRNKSYNEVEVLETLAELFAKYGFESTSIDQIAKATGMKRGSIYQAFASKANLFRLAFKHSIDTTGDHLLLADLLIVAMWERSATDADVRADVQRAIQRLESELNDSIRNILSDRLFNRASIDT